MNIFLFLVFFVDLGVRTFSVHASASHGLTLGVYPTRL